MIDNNVKVFLLEDSKTDQVLIKRAVLKVAPNAIFTIASNRGEFLDKITWTRPDIVLSDYHLPDYNGLEALFYMKENLPFVPFIFISGTLDNEELVAQTIIKGASGYILKDNLSTLTTQFKKYVEDAEERLAVAKEKEKKQIQHRILLQKLKAKLSQASPFPEKSELEELMSQILEHEA